jgi:phosphoglycerate dehydrogenase-like enzyme
VSGPVVVVSGATPDSQPPGIEPAAELADVRYAPDAATLATAITDAEALFFWQAQRAWIEDAFDRAPALRWIQSASDGVDGLLFPALVASEVAVTNARGVFDEPIAEWAIGAMCAFATGLHTTIVDQTRGAGWTDDRHRERLAGQHLVVVGPGPIGRATAARARALGLTVEAVGRGRRDDEVLGRVHAGDRLHEALGRADHVLDALPLTQVTRNLFDAQAFAAMPPSARFYNVGRGGTVDESALIEALRGGGIAGAALDVYDEEPLPASSPLWAMPNVIVSPHICGDVDGWEEAVVGVFVDNLGRFVRGEPLRNLVDTDHGFGVG